MGTNRRGAGNQIRDKKTDGEYWGKYKKYAVYVNKWLGIKRMKRNDTRKWPLLRGTRTEAKKKKKKKNLFVRGLSVTNFGHGNGSRVTRLR